MEFEQCCLSFIRWLRKKKCGANKKQYDKEYDGETTHGVNVVLWSLVQSKEVILSLVEVRIGKNDDIRKKRGIVVVDVKCYGREGDSSKEEKRWNGWNESF